ncbi:MAG: insulinase family protein [Desulfobacterales bacterium]|nr:insulinase family protein [Desulfobacterales bacterium]
MPAFEQKKQPGLKPGDRLSGYSLKRVETLAEIRSVYFELEHDRTGARHVHIQNDDHENTFSVAFKTVPTDSTGVAHILEHTVLCGSRKYPVRDPFFSMLKRSLSTFMNAFTASDWTMYPFSTQNRKDFYNLMDVYLDATFYPTLGELNFKQEGIRLEPVPAADSGQPSKLVYKGVVYNEMKGAMSSPDQVMARSLLNALYPDTTYSHNSGGDPAAIPQLTHSQLIAFHRRHYHPSNAYFYTYGDLPLAEHLTFIDRKVLTHFARIDPQTEVISQPRWPAPRTVTCPYPFDKGEDPAKKYQVCLAWLTADIQDTFEVLVLTLLEQILLGNSASPLRKALIDSGLGTALSDAAGFVPDHRDTMFAAGLKDVQQADADQVAAIIDGVLRGLAQDGVDRELVEAAIHQLEFHRKEITNTPYPYGLKLMLFFSGGWFHGGDPVRAFQFDADLDRIRAALAAKPFFENRIRRYFIDNPHRVLFTLAPDQQMADAAEERVAAELAAIRAELSAPEVEKIAADAEALVRLQEGVEDLSVLPTLALSDIPPAVQSVYPSAPRAGCGAVFFDQPTSGIFYFAAAIDAGSVPESQLALAPFFCHAFSRIGSSRRDYIEMARRIDRYTGGIGLSASARTRFDAAGDCLAFVTFNGKCLARNIEPMFEILREMVEAFDFSDLTRLRTLLLEYRAGLESMVVQNGHRLAISLAARHFSTAAMLSEIWSGVHHLKFIKAVSQRLSDDDLNRLAGELSALGRLLLKRGHLKIALVGESSALDRAAPLAAGLENCLPPGSAAAGFRPPVLQLPPEPPFEGWSTATAVSFVARAFQTVRMNHPDAPALAVIAKLLRSLFLHREIREKGGAYGGFALYGAEDGLFCLGSYRDPHVVSTLRVYEAAAGFIRSGSYTDEDIKEAVLQICSEIDKPDPPGPAARKAFYRGIIGLRDAAREDYKTRLLAISRDQVRSAAETYFSATGKPPAVAVISGEDKLQAANETLGTQALTLHRI